MDTDVTNKAGTMSARGKAGKRSKGPTADSMGESVRRDIRLGFLIHDVSRMRRKAFDQIMKPLGVTRAQWWVLAHLTRQDGMMQTQLADILDVGKASLGTLIERLETSGWVERRADPTDKRAKRIYLSRNVQPLLEKMIASEHTFNEQLLQGLTAEDRTNLVRLLSTLKQSLAQMDLGEASSDEE
ncbi:MarR family transcriptional regulator [Aromatoleum toluolicum]|uniref:MarR family transcriptional regulator n=1 Tax=Aromatoleum toluolicum TaxID=90060 RepID=A0ABX1NAX2_9RHOO|nr:MarR family transcriptional regulator [Aromatoleum toluolicum]NMF96422.1 MarR family transcriptional regulator [Aromatoleum toluolicum]